MRILYEGVAAVDLPRSRHEPFLEALLARVAHLDRFQLVVSGNFVASVKRHLPDRDEAAGYEVERLFGQATAKTFVRDNDVWLVVDADALRTGVGFDHHDPVRLAAHEAHHVSIHQRRECVTDLHLRRELETFTRLRYFVECASLIVEEYRVERALAEEGLDMHGSYRDELPDSLRAFRAQIVDGVTLRHPNEDIGRCAKIVMESFSRFTTLCAYLIADTPRTPPVLDRPLGRALAGEHYVALSNILTDVPSAAVPTPRATLDEYIDRLVDPLDHWLRHIGFAVEDRGGGLYFDVLRGDWDIFEALAA